MFFYVFCCFFIHQNTSRNHHLTTKITYYCKYVVLEISRKNQFAVFWICFSSKIPAKLFQNHFKINHHFFQHFSGFFRFFEVFWGFLRFFEVFRGFSRFLESQRAHLTHDYHTPPFFISTDATAYRSCQKCVTLLSPNSPHSHDSARICTPLNHLNLTLFDVFRRLHYFPSSAKENSRLHNFPASATESSRLHNFPSSATES